MLLRNVLLVLTIVILSNGQVNARPQSNNQEDKNNRAEAERLWELAIKARGGRERLLAVNNIHRSTRENYWLWLKRLTFIFEALYVFPGKSWEWDDQRGTVFGFTIRVHNFEKDLHQSYIERKQPGSVVQIMQPSVNDMIHLQLHLLGESKWVKPVPQSFRRGKVGEKDVDIVETRVDALAPDERKVEFALHRKTHLPVRVTYYWTRNGRELSGGISLSNYDDFDGIQMPESIGRFNAKYQANVEYNEQVLEQPPNVSAGIDAWKKR